jgi:hypothetical protein
MALVLKPSGDHPPAMSLAAARLEWPAWRAKIGQRIKAIRTGERSTVTHEQARALSGRWDERFVDRQRKSEHAQMPLVALCSLTDATEARPLLKSMSLLRPSRGQTFDPTPTFKISSKGRGVVRVSAAVSGFQAKGVLFASRVPANTTGESAKNQLPSQVRARRATNKRARAPASPRRGSRLGLLSALARNFLPCPASGPASWTWSPSCNCSPRLTHPPELMACQAFPDNVSPAFSD